MYEIRKLMEQYRDNNMDYHYGLAVRANNVLIQYDAYQGTKTHEMMQIPHQVEGFAQLLFEGEECIEFLDQTVLQAEALLNKR